MFHALQTVRPVVRFLAGATGAFLLTAKSGAQPKVTLGSPSAGSVPLSWTSIPGRTYAVETSDNLSMWSPLVVDPVIAASGSMALGAPAADLKRFYRVKENKYVDPAWADVKPLRTVPFSFDPLKTQVENGALLRTAMLALVPGDRLEIGPGTYSIASNTSLNLQGTAQNPIRIVSGTGGGVVITRPDGNQNTLNIGQTGSAAYLVLQGIEIRGGATGLNLGTCSHLWIDRCLIHQTGYEGIRGTLQDMSRIHITRNEIHTTGSISTGTGIYLGASSPMRVVSESVVAFNQIHNIGNSGAGIDLRNGSWGNLISGNTVRNCSTVGIYVLGTAGGVRNVIESNLCHSNGDYGLQVMKDATVRNNLVIDSNFGAFASIPLSGNNPDSLAVVHNTFVSTSHAARLSNWSLGTNMVFANNACYSRDQNAVFVSGSVGATTFAGLVAFGPVAAGIPSTPGTGLGDFTNLSWDGANRDAVPSSASPLRNAAAAVHATPWDLAFRPRTAPHTTGCHR